MNRSDPKQSVRELLEEAHPALVGLSHWIHANPEVGFEEHHASDWVNEWLQTAGFEVERGVADMPTALIGRFGPGPLHVAICVEYDALPEVGHACGHNVIAAAGVGAGLALASVADELGLRVSVMGTPAEETGGGKLRFIDAGYFDDVHAAAMVHPWPTDVATPDIIAITQLDVTYRGHEAHAAGFPHRGRNAADAMVIAQTAIGLLRQQLLSTDRVHGIVTKGGDAPNVIPAHTSALFMVRAADRERLEELTGLVRRCFEAGALATGTEVEVAEGTRYANMIHDADLAALYRHNAEQLGRVFDDTPGAPVSTDMGDVSHVVPSIHPMIGIETNGAVNHQREFAERCATPSADQAILDGALALAWTVIDAAQNQVIRARLLGDAVIREAVAIIQEVEELDTRADLLEDLAGTVAPSDPGLAAEITAAADALEEQADDLAQLADSRFEEAQELTDQALLEEVAGEIDSDLEDLAAGRLTGDAAELAVAEELLVVEGLVQEAALEGHAEAAQVDAEQAEADQAETLLWAEPDETAVATTEQAGETGTAASPVLSRWEPADGSEEVVSAEATTSEATTPEGAAPEATASTPAAALDPAHAAWERAFLEVARHADWEDEFAVALASATSDPTPPGDVEGDTRPTWEAATETQADPSPGAEARAEVDGDTEARAELGPDTESRVELESDTEAEASSDTQANAQQPWKVEFDAFVAEDATEGPTETADDQVTFEGVAEATSEDAGSLDEGSTSEDEGWTWAPAPPTTGSANAEASGLEAVAERDAPTGAVMEDEPATLDAVAEAAPEPWAEGGEGAEGEPELAGASADAIWDQPGPAAASSEAADDIWYSGAPDDELPSAERVDEEPVGATASGQRDGFVWIPADEEGR